jgi:hypothetical protein
MRIYAGAFAILFVLSCHGGKAKLVERKRLALEQMKDDHFLLEHIDMSHLDSVGEDKADTQFTSYFRDSCRWRKVYDSCQDELEKY